MRLTILHAIQTEAMTYNGVIEKDKLWEIAGDEWHPRFDVLGSIEDALAK